MAARGFAPVGRRAVKRLAERVLVGSKVTRIARAVRTRHGIVLAYHNILPDHVEPTGDRSLHLPRSRFAEQLEWIASEYDVVPLNEVIRSHASNDGGLRARSRVAITFDDAYRGAVTIGVDELVRRDLPATIFVAPALLGRDSFWWDAFAGPRRSVPAEFRLLALTACCGIDDFIRHRARTSGISPGRIVPEAAPATESELMDAARHRGITLGSHSWRHANLTRLTDEVLRSELDLPLRWLNDRSEAVIPWLSYPYGMTSAATRRAVGEAGYTAAVRVDGGPLTHPPAQVHALPRVNIPAGASREGFILRISGLTGRS